MEWPTIHRLSVGGNLYKNPASCFISSTGRTPVSRRRLGVQISYETQAIFMGMKDQCFHTLNEITGMKALIYKEVLNERHGATGSTVITVYFCGMPIYKSYIFRDFSQ